MSGIAPCASGPTGTPSRRNADGRASSPKNKTSTMLLMPMQRPVYVLLSARSLPYAGLCLESLFKRALEPLSLTMITDGPDDKAALAAAMERIAPDPKHRWAVYDEADADA